MCENCNIICQKYCVLKILYYNDNVRLYAYFEKGVIIFMNQKSFDSKVTQLALHATTVCLGIGFYMLLPLLNPYLYNEKVQLDYPFFP